MREQDREHFLIGNILNLLHTLQKHGLDLDQLTEQDGLEKIFSQQDAQDLKGAYELVKFMDEMPGGFLIYYADGGKEIIYANRALLQIFQCGTMAEFRELTGNSFCGIVHPEDLDVVEQSIKNQIYDSPLDLDYVEYRIIRKDGAIRWIEDYGHFVRSESYRNVFYVFLIDATGKRQRLLDEKRREEQKLQDLKEAYSKERSMINQEYLRRMAVIEGLSINYESIFYVNLDEDQILPYRLSARSGPLFDEKLQMLEFSRTISNYADTWVHPEDREVFQQAANSDYIQKKLAESRTYYINYRVLNGTEEQYLQMRIVNVGHQERASLIVMGFRRVDEEIQHEMEQNQMLAQALDSATQAIGVKDIFLSNMSHDMRTPLNAIFGFTALAKRNSHDPDAVQSYLGRIEASGRQLLDLINKVLELSQAESGEAHMADLEFDLCETIQEIYNFLLPQADEKGIDFFLDCSGVVHKDICGDQEKLKQLMMYLANNAVTYTKYGGRITITASEQEKLPNQYAVYQLIVEDTGIGISEEFLDRIFEPFSREKNTTLSGIHGIGLGLSIAKNIVDLMGGTIHVDSTVGKGSIFTITLRFRIQPQSLPTDSGAGGSDAEAKSQKILLVEDNEINLEIETEILQELGFDIEAAADGSIAVEKIRNASPGQYDLILMDIQMPVMDGWQAAREIRRLSDPALARIPIIALSANVFESDMRKSEESGMNAHLPKPLDIALLLDTVEKITKKRTI